MNDEQVILCPIKSDQNTTVRIWTSKMLTCINGHKDNKKQQFVLWHEAFYVLLISQTASDKHAGLLCQLFQRFLENTLQEIEGVFCNLQYQNYEIWRFFSLQSRWLCSLLCLQYNIDT